MSSAVQIDSMRTFCMQLFRFFFCEVIHSPHPPLQKFQIKNILNMVIIIELKQIHFQAFPKPRPFFGCSKTRHDSIEHVLKMNSLFRKSIHNHWLHSMWLNNKYRYSTEKEHNTHLHAISIFSCVHHTLQGRSLAEEIMRIPADQNSWLWLDKTCQEY